MFDFFIGGLVGVAITTLFRWCIGPGTDLIDKNVFIEENLKLRHELAELTERHHAVKKRFKLFRDFYEGCADRSRD